MSVESVVGLAREYACILGAPVIAAVEVSIFSLRYFKDCMACGFCHDACCTHGVDIDLDNAARMNALPRDFEDFIGVARSEWFAGLPVSDAEFPSGAHLRTNVRNGACVFLNRAGRGCKIHSYCLANDLDYHALKPLVSVLFPVSFEHGVLVASNELVDGSLVCSGAGPTLYEGARAELIHYFGEEFVAELDALNRLHA